MAEKLLPLGTVVNLKGSKKAMMIFGYCSISVSKPGEMYDYSGFPYPEGYTETLKIYQFNSDQIEAIHALGYQDLESHRYLEYLGGQVENLRQQVAEKAGTTRK